MTIRIRDDVARSDIGTTTTNLHVKSTTMSTSTTTTTSCDESGATTTTTTTTSSIDAISSPSSAGPTREGNFANPESSLGNDPRIDPAFLAHIMTAPEPVANMLAAKNTANPLEAAATQAQRMELSVAVEQGYEGAFGFLISEVPMDGLVETTETIEGVDGNEITLYITKPVGDGPFPVVVHLHGGGMAILTAADAANIAWRRRIAQRGAIVIGVEFRNAAGKLGPYKFPAGLNDCLAGVEWAHANRDKLGSTGQIVVCGESGGGNLSLATALKAKKEGKAVVSGVYAMCPYVAGPEYYDSAGKHAAELQSMAENDGIMMNVGMLNDMAKLYTEDTTNSLAWPLFATKDELTGMPPTVISVNECDPLRDEGKAMYRNLAAAGVKVSGKMVLGTPHAGEIMAQLACTTDTLDSLVSFARSLSPVV